MASKSLLAMLALAALAAAGWHYRDTEPLRSWLRPARAAVGGYGFDDGSGQARRQDTRPAGGAAPKRLRKCVQDGQPTYTDEACPAGTQEQPMSGGAVTVLPAQPVPAPAVLPRPALPAASGNSLRETLLPGNDNLRDKRMEKIIHQ